MKNIDKWSVWKHWFRSVDRGRIRPDDDQSLNIIIKKLIKIITQIMPQINSNAMKSFLQKKKWIC